MRKTAQQGFTLIEMAIVLVVIGLILGMVFKGRELIASAKVKNANAAYNKVIAGMNTYLDRYGVYPGDGCASATPSGPNACTSTKNGLVGADDNEEKAFFYLLTTTGILTTADTKSSLGDSWGVTGNANSTWIYANSTDLRLACDLDRVADDGDADTGIIRTNTAGTVNQDFAGDNAYANGDDCWNLAGTRHIMLKVLP